MMLDLFSRIGTRCALLHRQLHDFCLLLKMLQERCIERFLQELGTQLIIAGQEIKNSIGNVTIQNPEHNASSKLLDQLIEELLEKYLRWFMWFIIVITICCVIGYSIFCMEELELSTTSHSSSKVDVDGASKKVKGLTRGELVTRTKLNSLGLKKQHENKPDETDICVICLEEKYCNAAYVPCGHLCSCMKCSSLVKLCPLCRKPIDKVLQVYCLWRHGD